MVLTFLVQKHEYSYTFLYSDMLSCISCMQQVLYIQFVQYGYSDKDEYYKTKNKRGLPVHDTQSLP